MLSVRLVWDDERVLRGWLSACVWRLHVFFVVVFVKDVVKDVDELFEAGDFEHVHDLHVGVQDVLFGVFVS